MSVLTLLPRFCRWAIPALVLLFVGCQKKVQPGVVLAQVDQAQLTLAEVRESFPPELEKVLGREQYLDFIQRWIDDEVIYQQALKLKLDQDPAIQRRLERMRRKVILEELLAREVSGEDFEPDEGAITRYYEMHPELFKRKTPEFRYATIRLATLKEALTLRSKTKDEEFLSLVPRDSTVSSSDHSSQLPLRKPSEIPACLMEKMLEAKPGFFASPIICSEGIFLLKLFDRVEAGSLMPFAEVKDGISGQLAMEHRDRMRESKIKQFREGIAITYDIDKVPGVEMRLSSTMENDVEEPAIVNPPPPKQSPKTRPSMPKKPKTLPPPPPTSNADPVLEKTEPIPSEGNHDQAIEPTPQL